MCRRDTGDGIPVYQGELHHSDQLCAHSQALRENNIDYVVAPYEADAQLCYLERTGVVDGIITEDSDLLVFGCKMVIFKLQEDGSCTSIERDHLSKVGDMPMSGWTPTEFRRMAVSCYSRYTYSDTKMLSGCDYLPSIPGIGLKTAHRLMRRHKGVEKLLQAVRLEGLLTVPPKYLDAFRQAELAFLYQRVFCPKEKRLVPLGDFPDEGLSKDDEKWIGLDVDVDIARGMAAGDLHPATREPIKDLCPGAKVYKVTDKVKAKAPKTGTIANWFKPVPKVPPVQPVGRMASGPARLSDLSSKQLGRFHSDPSPRRPGTKSKFFPGQPAAADLDREEFDLHHEESEAEEVESQPQGRLGVEEDEWGEWDDVESQPQSRRLRHASSPPPPDHVRLGSPDQGETLPEADETLPDGTLRDETRSNDHPSPPMFVSGCNTPLSRATVRAKSEPPFSSPFGHDDAPLVSSPPGATPPDSVERAMNALDREEPPSPTPTRILVPASSQCATFGGSESTATPPRPVKMRSLTGILVPPTSSPRPLRAVRSSDSIADEEIVTPSYALPKRQAKRPVDEENDEEEEERAARARAVGDGWRNKYAHGATLTSTTTAATLRRKRPSLPLSAAAPHILGSKSLNRDLDDSPVPPPAQPKNAVTSIQRKAIPTMVVKANQAVTTPLATTPTTTTTTPHGLSTSALERFRFTRGPTTRDR